MRRPHVQNAMIGKPRQSVACLTLLFALVFAVGHVRYVIGTVAGAEMHADSWVILVAKTTTELIASTFGIAFLVSAFTFLFMRDRRLSVHGAAAHRPSIGIVYLCCDDG